MIGSNSLSAQSIIEYLEVLVCVMDLHFNQQLLYSSSQFSHLLRLWNCQPLLLLELATYDLSTQPVHFDTLWNHLNSLHLADPDFGEPRRMNILLGIDIYTDTMLQGRRSVPLGHLLYCD